MPMASQSGYCGSYHGFQISATLCVFFSLRPLWVPLWHKTVFEIQSSFHLKFVSTEVHHADVRWSCCLLFLIHRVSILLSLICRHHEKKDTGKKTWHPGSSLLFLLFATIPGDRHGEIWISSFFYFLVLYPLNQQVQ